MTLYLFIHVHCSGSISFDAAQAAYVDLPMVARLTKTSFFHSSLHRCFIIAMDTPIFPQQAPTYDFDIELQDSTAFPIPRTTQGDGAHSLWTGMAVGRAPSTTSSEASFGLQEIRRPFSSAMFSHPGSRDISPCPSSGSGSTQAERWVQRCRQLEARNEQLVEEVGKLSGIRLVHLLGYHYSQ